MSMITNVLRIFFQTFALIFFFDGFQAFNVHTSPFREMTLPESFQGMNSYFGHSLSLVSKSSRNFELYVGSPRLTSSFSQVNSSGGVIKCGSAGSCEEMELDKGFYELSGFWSGATMDVIEDRQLLVCSPRYHNIRSSSQLGFCSVQFLLSGEITFPITPRSEEYMGLSIFAHNNDLFDNYVIGMPRSNNLKLLVRDRYSKSVRSEKQHSSEFNYFNYYGYAVAAGNITGTLNVIGGAPRGSRLKGFVTISDFILDRSSVIQVLSGHQLGEYFGSSVATCDVNGDGFQELVVGAPMHSVRRTPDVGCVYVYENTDGKILDTKFTKHYGDSDKSGRFGTAISTSGDINKDGYQDFFVGAPYEDGEGRVYVFEGSPEGVKPHFTQVIFPESPNTCKGFGISFSRLVDIDENYYPDVAIGCFKSDKAVILRTRPVVTIRSSLSTTNQKLGLEQTQVDVSSCFIYDDIFAPDDIEFSTIFSLVFGFYSAEPPLSFDSSGRTRHQSLLTIRKNEISCQTMTLVVTQSKGASYRETMQLRLAVEEKDVGKIITIATNLPPIVTRTVASTLDFAFVTGCETDGDPSCIVDLAVFVSLAGKSTSNTEVVNGEVTEISLQMVVSNNGEPAFLPNVSIQATEPLRVIPPDDLICEQLNTPPYILTCQLTSPLVRSNRAEFELLVDMRLLMDSPSDLEVRTQAGSAADLESDLDNNIAVFKIKSNTKASLYVIGTSSKEQIVYPLLENGEIGQKESIEFFHSVTVSKEGISPIEFVEIAVDIPFSDNLDLEFLHLYNYRFNFHGESVKSCSLQNGRWIIPAHSETNQTQSRSLADNTYTKIVAASRNASLDRFLNCSNKDVKCATLTCLIGPWRIGQDSATLTWYQKIDYETLGQLISKVAGMTLESTVRASVKSNVDRNSFIGNSTAVTSISTIFLAKAAIKTSVAWWVWVIAGVAGVLVFVLISVILYKVGFFNRSKKDQLLARKAASKRIQNPEL